MAKMKCRCGKLLSDSVVPNDIELVVYTDRQWEEEVNIGVINSIEIPKPEYSVWRCPNCERIYVWNKTNERALKVYALEGDPKD